MCTGSRSWMLPVVAGAAAVLLSVGGVDSFIATEGCDARRLVPLSSDCDAGLTANAQRKRATAILAARPFAAPAAPPAPSARKY